MSPEPCWPPLVQTWPLRPLLPPGLFPRAAGLLALFSLPLSSPGHSCPKRPAGWSSGEADTVSKLLIPGRLALELSFKWLSDPQQHSGHIPRESADEGQVCLFSEISKKHAFFPLLTLNKIFPPPTNTCIFNFMRKYGKEAYFLL